MPRHASVISRQLWLVCKTTTCTCTCMRIDPRWSDFGIRMRHRCALSKWSATDVLRIKHSRNSEILFYLCCTERIQSKIEPIFAFHSADEGHALVALKRHTAPSTSISARWQEDTSPPPSPPPLSVKSNSVDETSLQCRVFVGWWPVIIGTHGMLLRQIALKVTRAEVDKII